MTLQKFMKTLAVVTPLLLPTAAGAMHPLITDDASTLGQDKYQLEVNGQYDHDDEGPVESTTKQMAAGLSYGATDTIDLVAGIPYLWAKERETGAVVSNENGASDASLDVKWRFFEKDGLSLAMKPGLVLPTGNEDKGLGAGKVGYRFYAIASKEVNPWSIHANLGYIRNENDGEDRVNFWHASLAGTYLLRQDLTLVGNIHVDRNADPSSDNNPAYLLGGLVYSLAESLDIDCGYKHSLTSDGPDWSLLAGMTFHF